MECEYSSLTSALAFPSRLCHTRRCVFEAGDAPLPQAVGSQRVRRALGARKILDIRKDVSIHLCPPSLPQQKANRR